MKIIFYPIKYIDPYDRPVSQARCPMCGSTNVFFAPRVRRIVTSDGQTVKVTRRIVDSGICRDCWHTDNDDNFNVTKSIF
jgi:hypothetical protein